MPPLTSWFYSWISSRCASSLRWRWCCYWKVSVWTSEQQLQEVVKKKWYFYLRDLALHSGQTFLPAGKMMSGHVSTIFSSAFGKHVTYTHTHAHARGCFSYCLIPVTYHTLLGESQHWRKDQLLSSRKHRVKWEGKQKEDRRVFSAAHLGRPTFDKQHRTDEESRGWKKMRTHSDQTVHSMLYKLNVHPSFESPAVFLNLLMQSSLAFATSRLFISVTRYRRGVLTRVFVCSVSCFVFFISSLCR